MSSWDRYAICPCGWYTVAPANDKFHIHKEVCPDCGRNKSEWYTHTAREVKKPTKHWWQFSSIILERKDK